MACKFCKLAIPDLDDICPSCAIDPTKVIQHDEMIRKYKLTKTEMSLSKLTPLKYGNVTILYDLETVWSIFDSVPDTDMKKKNCIRQKKLIEKLNINVPDILTKKKQITSTTYSFLIKYGIVLNDYTFQEFNRLVSHYMMVCPFDLFKVSMSIADYLYKHHLYVIEQEKLRLEQQKIISEQTTRKETIMKLLESKKYNKKHMNYVYASVAFNEYVTSNKGNLNTIVDIIQKSVDDQIEREKRNIMLDKELSKHQLSYYKGQAICNQYVQDGKISLQTVLNHINGIIIKQQKIQKFHSLLYSKQINYQLYPAIMKSQIYKDYMNDVVTLDYLSNNIVKISEIIGRKKQVIDFIKNTFSNRYKKCIIKRYHKGTCQKIQEDFIEKNCISFNTVKDMLLELEENLIDNATNLSYEWKEFLKKTNKRDKLIKAKFDVKYDTQLFAFCDQDININTTLEIQIQQWYNNIGNKNMLYIENRCKQLGLKCVRQFDQLKGMILIVSK